MKNQLQPHPIEIGAGFGLMLFSIVIMLIDKNSVPYGSLCNALGLMLSMGLFSGNYKKKSCKENKFSAR